MEGSHLTIEKRGGIVTITVSQLNSIAKNLLEASHDLTGVWVSGEVSNLTKHPSGHYYFTLKDDRSEIKCTFFKNARIRVALEIEGNMKVLALGSMSVYVPKGNYQFNVQDVKAQGVGDLHLAYEALKKKLEGEGLFELSRKRPLPRYPNRIGVVTSPTGAAIRDILNITSRRFPADILLAPALVQGDGAADSIIQGITRLNDAGVDVIIVGRGGGSLEDLWSFNEEAVVRAIYASRVPVVSAVGHETDFTLSDFVADLRAPTPSAAAELVLPDRTDEKRNLESLFARAQTGLRSPLVRMRHRIAMTDSLLAAKRMTGRIEQAEMRLDDLSSHLDIHMRERIDAAANRFGTLLASLEGLNPNRVLERGYCFVQSQNGKLINSVDRAEVGETVRIVMKDGALKAKVTEKV
jgi:exodeoxyribonuclease VII large subunit